MIHIPGRIPILIHPAFWIFAALIGFMSSGSLVGTLVWVGIIFVSVLFHEFGHALTAVFFGQKPRIELVALGGLTYHDGQRLPFWKQFFIVLDGPLFGFILYGICSFLLHIPGLNQGLLGTILLLTKEINLFWTVVNLLPVMPLDGGQLLRIILEGVCGAKGVRYALITGIVVAVGISLFFFLYQAFLIGALFFLLAFQSYDALRKTRQFSEADRSEDLRDLLARIEKMMREGKKEEAMRFCERARAQAKKGMLFNLATQYLAFLKYETGRSKEVYELLLPIRSALANDALCLLQKVAFEQGDFSLVVELASSCFQTWPTVETAIRNALAHAALKQSTAAVGWLETALEEGLDNIKDILAEKLIDPIREDPVFQSFLERLPLN